MNIKRWIFVGMIWGYGFLSAASAERIYVNASAAPGGNGASWATAFQFLQDALDQTVSGRGDDLWIAAGTYYPDDGANVTKGDRESSFFVKDGVSLYGGFAGGETELDQRAGETQETVLSGKIFEQDTYWAIHVCTVAPEAEVRFDGLTVTGGHANGTATGQNWAAAVYCSSNTYTVRSESCCFIENKSIVGGVACYGTWEVSNTIFSGNFASNGGGVAYYSSWDVSNSTFSGNSAGSCGGVACDGTWKVSSSSFNANSARDGGVAYNGTWEVSTSTFIGNSATSVLRRFSWKQFQLSAVKKDGNPVAFKRPIAAGIGFHGLDF